MNLVISIDDLTDDSNADSGDQTPPGESSIESICQLARTDSSVDSIILKLKLDSLRNGVLQECIRVLRPGGLLKLEAPVGWGVLQQVPRWLPSLTSQVSDLGLEQVAREERMWVLRKEGEAREDVHLKPYFAVHDLNHAVELTCKDYSLDLAEARAEREAELMSPYLQSWMTVLDWGCGMGRLARTLANRVNRVVATDLAPPMLEQARTYLADVSNVELCSCADPAFAPDKKADFACAILVLQHLPPPEAHRLLLRIAGCCHMGAVICAQLPVLTSYNKPQYEAHTPGQVFGDRFEILDSVERPEELGRWRDQYFFVRRRF